MGDRLADFEGDRDDQTLEENQERAAEGNIIKEDILKEQTESLAEGEEDTGYRTLEENEAKSLVESKGDTNDQTLDENQGRPAEGNRSSKDLLKEQLEMLIGMMRFLDRYEEDAGRAAEGTLRKEDLLKKQIESLVESEGDAGDRTLEENEGREAEGNRTHEDFVKDQIEMWTGMKRFLDKHEKDAGAASGSLLRMTNLAKEQINKLLRSARESVDPTVQNTTGKTDDWKELEDFCKGQIDLVNAFREIHDPNMEKIKGRFAEGMDLMADIFQELLDKLAALKEAEHPTEEDNEGISPDVMGILQDFMTAQINLNPLVQRSIECIEESRGPLAEVQVNVDDWKRIITESMAFAKSVLDSLSGELHRTVLHRCLPQLIKHLDFESVFQSIQQKEFFDDVTMRDIKELKNTTEKIKELIQQVMQRGPKAYEMFKECLVETEQTNLLEQLEHQEAEFQSHGNSC